MNEEGDKELAPIQFKSIFGVEFGSARHLVAGQGHERWEQGFDGGHQRRC